MCVRVCLCVQDDSLLKQYVEALATLGSFTWDADRRQPPEITTLARELFAPTSPLSQQLQNALKEVRNKPWFLFALHYGITC